MVTPATRRAAVSFFRERHGISERSACRLASLSRSTYRRKSLRREADKPLSERLLELAAERPRFGYRRLHVMLVREGWPVYPTGAEHWVSITTIADLDGDGSCEVIGAAANSLRVFNADGSVFAPPHLAVGSEGLVAVANMDAEEDLEVVVAGQHLGIHNVDVFVQSRKEQARSKTRCDQLGLLGRRFAAVMDTRRL